jgi:hypothetical protein
MTEIRKSSRATRIDYKKLSKGISQTEASSPPPNAEAAALPPLAAALPPPAAAVEEPRAATPGVTEDLTPENESSDEEATTEELSERQQIDLVKKYYKQVGFSGSFSGIQSLQRALWSEKALHVSQNLIRKAVNEVCLKKAVSVTSHVVQCPFSDP